MGSAARDIDSRSIRGQVLKREIKLPLKAYNIESPLEFLHIFGHTQRTSVPTAALMADRTCWKSSWQIMFYKLSISAWMHQGLKARFRTTRESTPEANVQFLG